MTFDPNDPPPSYAAPQSPAEPPLGPPPHYGTPAPRADLAPAAGQRRGPAPGMDERGKVKRGRVSTIWVGLIIAAILLIALLIFIAQNSRTVIIHFLGLSGHVSLAVAILAAAVLGVLVPAIPGTARIFQLRRALKKNASTP